MSSNNKLSSFRPESEEILFENLSRMLAAVKSTGADILLVEDIPKVCTSDEYAIWRNGFLDTCKTSKRQSLEHRKALSDLYVRLKHRYKHVNILDPHEIFCPGETCSNYLAQELIYSDGSPHLTVKASERLTPVLIDVFDINVSPALHVRSDTKPPVH